MNTPDQESIDNRLEVAKKSIDRSWMLFKKGFYDQNDIPHQSLCSRHSGNYANLGRALFLNNVQTIFIRR